MATTTGHIKAIISADNSQYMAVSKRTRQDAKTLKRDIEQQKPKIDADSRPFLETIKRVSLAVGGLNAGMLAGGAASAAAIGGIPVLFAAIAAAALASDQKVSDSFRHLAGNVVDDVKAMAAPMQDDLVGVAHELGRAWAALAPQMQKAFADPAVGRGVRELATGLGELANNAMPGVLESVRQSGPVMTGFRKLMGDVGTGTSELLSTLARESESSGTVIEGFGSITRTTLGDLGSLLGKLSASVAPHMGEIEQAFDQTTGSVVGLASGALPVLTSASSATLSVLNGLLGVVEPISSQLGTGIGVILAAAGGWRVLQGATSAYTKLDLPGKLSSAALSAGVFTESLTGSANAGEKVATAGSKMGTVLRGVGTALPWVGIGAIALAVALDASAKSMEQAVQRGDGLAQSLIKGGSEADRARQTINRLTTENQGYQTSLNGLVAQQKVAGTAAGTYSREIGDLRDKIDTNNASIDTARTKYDDIRKSLTGSELAQVQYNEAVEKHGATSTQAAAAGQVWRAALDADKAKQDAAAEATKTHTDRIVEQQARKLGAISADLSYQSSLLGVERAQKAVNDATTRYGKDSLEAREANVSYQQQLVGATTSLYEKVRAENVHRGETEANRIATQAQTGEILRLAAAAGGTAPPALMSMVAGLDATTLGAMGVTARVNEAGNAVYRLPDGKEIVLKGHNADAIAKINEVNAMKLHEKTLWINTVMRNDNKVAQGYGDSGMNSGGWVPGNGPDRDDRLVPLTSKEFVVTRKAAQRYGPFLEAINKAAGGEVRMPEPMLASAPMPRLGAPVQAAAQAVSRSTGDALGMVSGGKTVNRYYNITLNEIKSMPSKEWFRNTLEDVDRGITI